jgi:hypothetical protein
VFYRLLIGAVAFVSSLASTRLSRVTLLLFSPLSSLVSVTFSLSSLLSLIVFFSLPLHLLFSLSSVIWQASLDALPIGAGDVDRLLSTVRSLVPQDRNLTLAEALAEPSPAGKKSALDAKSVKYVRRWLDKRRHAYRDRRVSRVTKLLQEFHASEITFLSFLRSVIALRPAMVAAGASPEDVELVFGEISRAADVHAQLVHLGAQASGEAQVIFFSFCFFFSFSNFSPQNNDSVAQRRFVAEFVLEPLLAVVRS